MRRARFNVVPVEHYGFISIVSLPWSEPYFQVYREWGLIEGFGNPEHFLYFSLFTCSFILRAD